MNLYEISEAMIDNLNIFLESEGTELDKEVHDEVMALLKKELSSKSSNLLKYLNNLQCDLEQIRLEKQRLEKIKKSKESKYEKLSEYIIYIMQTLHKAKIETEIGNYADLDELRTDVSNSRLRESAVSDMNMENGETRFRNSFVQRYPMFLSELKKQAPDITHREELLCMLLTLDYTPDQIADIFCVTRKSLNMMRYRIRAKLHSDHDDSLEENLKKILR